MKPHKNNEILYVDTPYRPDPGHFAKAIGAPDNNRYTIGQWRFCRELFHGQLYNLKLFFYSHEVSRGQCIVEFMRLVEEKLNVTPRSDFGLTQRKTIIWIRPSRWWIVKSMKRSLLTLLLRTASAYVPVKNNFEEALYSHMYASGTRYAIKRFFDGYTHYTGRKIGWYKQFHDYKPTPAQIDLLLIKE